MGMSNLSNKQLNELRPKNKLKEVLLLQSNHSHIRSIEPHLSVNNNP